MIVRNLDEVVDTDSEVCTPNWRSRRLVLAREGVGFSLHDTIAYAGTVNDWWYANHVEAVYCIEGEGDLVNRETGETHRVAPGTLYLLDGHERHRLVCHTDVRMVCVFNPPVVGREVHDENGVYPLLAESTS